jgi:hypothetical protein
MFTGISEEICAEAWAVLVPAITKAAELEVTNGLRGTIIVLDPNSPTNEVLFTGHVGDEDPEFLRNVHGKVAVTLRTGLDSEKVRMDLPHLYQAGDIKYPGAIRRDGLVVAFSGIQGEFDVMICEWMVATIRAICRVEMHGPGGADEQPGAYLTA